MKGLLVEDDKNKANKILNYIKEHFPQVMLELAGSYQSGLKKIFESAYDFILLDMSIPTYDQIEGSFSGKPRNYGGRDVLKEMKRYKKQSAVIVITQYSDFDGGISLDELDQQLREFFPDLYYGHIFYSAKQQDWEPALGNFLNTFRKI